MKKIVFIFALIILIACSEDYQASTHPTYVEKVDTLVVNSTDTLFMTEHDTVLVSSSDTIRVSVLDTIILDHIDTVTVPKVIKDTIILKEFFNNTDTLKIVDTVTKVDTIEITVTDTIKSVDTIKVITTDTISIKDTVKIIDTVFVDVSSSSETIIVSSSSVEESSSSEEVKGSVLDSITTFKVDGKLYTLYAPTIYAQEVDPEIFHYAARITACEDMGGVPVTDQGEIMKIKDQAFSLVGTDSTTFIGIFKTPRFAYKMIVAYDTSFIYVKDRGAIATYNVDILFPRNTRQYAGYVKTSPIQTYGAFHACRFDD